MTGMPALLDQQASLDLADQLLHASGEYAKWVSGTAHSCVKCVVPQHLTCVAYGYNNHHWQ